MIYEDDDILVINKPMGLVVHPGAGNPDGTVLNALLHHYPDIINVPRAGIVHRLDKDHQWHQVSYGGQIHRRIASLLR